MKRGISLEKRLIRQLLREILDDPFSSLYDTNIRLLEARLDRLKSLEIERKERGI